MAAAVCRVCRPWLQSATRRRSSPTGHRLASSDSRPNASFVDSRNAPSDFETSAAVVYNDFCTQEEADDLVADVLSRMRRRRYEKGHWDAVITSYKEVELLNESSLSPLSQQVMDRTRHFLEQNHLHPPITWLPSHAIDLKAAGELKAHVDSIKFSGDLVAGISLLSSSIMRLKPENNDTDKHVDLYLPPLSLYVMTGVARYHYTHELLSSGAVFEQDGNEIEVTRDHRLSIIFRDAKKEESM